MAEFCIEIAGRRAQVTSLFDSTRDYCRAYLTEEAPDFAIRVTKEDLLFEQQALDEEAREEGFRRRRFTDPFLDRAAVQRKMADDLFDHDTLLLHGSAVAVDGKGYLFTAKSGTGKSTHTRLWRQVFADRAVMINDDKPFLRILPEEIRLCGAPWSGKHGLDTNICVPLQGICILQRGEENRMESISPSEALPLLLHQSTLPLDPGKHRRYRKLLEEAAARTKLWKMACTKEERAAQMAYEAMK